MDGRSFPFVIGQVVTTRFGRELRDAMATEALVLNSMATVDGQTVWCAQLVEPVQLRIGWDDRDRYDPAYVGEDNAGAFLWTFFVTIHPHIAGSFTAGARGVVADLAFVVDASLSSDPYFDPGKVRWAATVVVDAARSSPPLPVNGDRDRMSHPSLSPEHPTGVPHDRSGNDGSHDGRSRTAGEVSAEEFRLALEGAISRLAAMTGTPVGDVPRPREVKARKHSRHRGSGPTYSIGREVRYHTADPMHGLIWKESDDPDEALYWLVDDIARSLALGWARRAPAAAVMNSQQVLWSLAIPMWQTLMTALDTRWEPRTRSRIAHFGRQARASGRGAWRE
ncbi:MULTISPECIES: hypothetical protein [Mycobacterium avium complex (MAC)]|uniref:hypothetical protein n=1 Tax=Mycobacterium avium complex (MAC) TaxID=120793 RepID=UPI0009FED283|nr:MULTISPECIES: hypothetical protein [Mycobacterium avium complex (MAC)]UCN12864.1 immunity 63 family protein [Mycobacterium intracellulare subsp. chimaera]